MRSDIDRWNKKYARENQRPGFRPESILNSYKYLLNSGGMALDVACGKGYNSIFLAEQGYDVISVDGSITGLNHLKKMVNVRDLNIQIILADLDDFVLPKNYFDVVLIVRFLNRDLVPRLKDTLKIGGLLIYHTFNMNLLTIKPTFNENFLLIPGELALLFNDFNLIATNDSDSIMENMTYWIGRKP